MVSQHAPGNMSPSILLVNHNREPEWTSLLFFLCAAIRFDEIRVFGYTAWSLLDGFEWQDAYTTRRGLFYVDFNSKQKERRPKSSAHYYKQIVQENGFTLKESTADVQGQFPCDFSWGVTESVLKVSGYLQINYELVQQYTVFYFIYSVTTIRQYQIWLLGGDGGELPKEEGKWGELMLTESLSCARTSPWWWRWKGCPQGVYSLEGIYSCFWRRHWSVVSKL